MRRLPLFVSVIVAATMLGAGTAAAVPPEAPEGFQYVSANEQVMLGIVCAPNEAGQCTSEGYTLGRQPGDSSVGNALTFTPLEYLFAATGEEAPFATFTADDTLEPEYVLRSDQPIRGQIQVGGWAGGAEVGADATVKVVLRALRAGTGFNVVDLGTATVNKPVVTPGAAGQTYAFEITLPETLDGVKIQNLEMDLYFRGVHVLQNGFVNGEGGSFFDLPYYELVPTQ